MTATVAPTIISALLADKPSIFFLSIRNVDPFEVLIAMDGLAVFVNENIEIDELTIEQAGAIFRGDITNWSELGGSDLAVERLNKSLDAFVEQDDALAKEVARADEEIDELDEQIFRELITFMISDPQSIKQASALIFISRFLERIGDHSTNICEGVIYLISGERQAY